MYGERLRQLRKAKKWTMEGVGERLGIKKSSYAGYENESRLPPIDKLQKLAIMYDVSTDYILGLTEDPDPKKDRRDIREFLDKEQLTWNGKPISEEELEPIKQLLEIVVRDRMPGKNNNHNNNNNNNNRKTGH